MGFPDFPEFSALSRAWHKVKKMRLPNYGSLILCHRGGYSPFSRKLVHLVVVHVKGIVYQDHKALENYLTDVDDVLTPRLPCWAQHISSFP